eukprot:TRINITY_DN9399_c0_g1_i1.p2 TRINITY_DN9399_c0_g1~~TRINITY_DN9399_c0_g1_i1.p2  ORF type:complete len:107 (-),score=19.28 TRINITY_DN9399_c0_g1_i1:320-640(-)
MGLEVVVMIVFDVPVICVILVEVPVILVTPIVPAPVPTGVSVVVERRGASVHDREEKTEKNGGELLNKRVDDKTLEALVEPLWDGLAELLWEALVESLWDELGEPL